MRVRGLGHGLLNIWRNIMILPSPPIFAIPFTAIPNRVEKVLKFLILWRNGEDAGLIYQGSAVQAHHRRFFTPSIYSIAVLLQLA